MKEATNIFRVLIKTLLKAGIITDRTRAVLRDLRRHGRAAAPKATSMVGDDIAEEGIKYLQTINFGVNTDALDEVKAAAVAAE